MPGSDRAAGKRQNMLDRPFIFAYQNNGHQSDYRTE